MLKVTYKYVCTYPCTHIQYIYSTCIQYVCICTLYTRMHICVYACMQMHEINILYNHILTQKNYAINTSTM